MRAFAPVLNTPVASLTVVTLIVAVSLEEFDPSARVVPVFLCRGCRDQQAESSCRSRRRF